MCVAQRRRIVGVEEGEALHDVLGGPGAQLQPDITAAFEFQRHRTGRFHGTRHPPALAGEPGQRGLAVAVVEQHAGGDIAALVGFDEGLRHQRLEVGDALQRRAMRFGDELQLRAMVEGKDVQRRGDR